jgi:dipeptidyl aminopeptidase/acylaminoacyl peptidase
MRRSMRWIVISVLILSGFAVRSAAQGRVIDYERADGLRKKFTEAVVDLPERAVWIEDTPRFWYRKTVKGGNAFVLCDAATLSVGPAFDHDKLAASLSAASKAEYTAVTLPFNRISYVEEEKSMEFEAADFRWRCNLETYVLEKIGPVERRRDGWQRVGWPQARAASEESKTSPDGKWEAFIENFNVSVRSVETREKTPLSFEGSEGDYYAFESLAWSPDSKKIAAYRIRPGFTRVISYVESSPADRLQPVSGTLEYTKPGDPLDIPQPVLFDVENRGRIEVDNALFPNPYNLSLPVWRKDGRAFTFEYNARGHQLFRVIEVAAGTGEPRALISEEAETFFNYSGKKFRHDVDDGREIIWMSERDGWNHLYLYDGASGTVKNRITAGEWVVRGVDKVDEENRVIWFHAGGMNPGIDPYFVHYYRIDFDGENLVALTEGDAHHTVSLSPDRKFYAEIRSRVDLPPVMRLRQTEDGKILRELENVDISGLKKAGWRAPEVFKAKGRDGTTDIWGAIVRPTNFDPKRKYPVIENIYAGPHSAHVPKAFLPYSGMMAVAELGFIVVQIDGMGTSHRSKAFHDVCWQNLGDAGFPDRILWHKAAAAKYAHYDLRRVGIYGTSAGAQNAMGALLFHPEFYHAAYASCGCHDNRMDKIWWNEQWMGWPLGPHYAASSNVDNAHRLKGKLLLVVGEMDTNVDPASTMQVVDALIKAGKSFDLLVLPGANHTGGGAYGERKRNDFFVRHLLGVEPPDWNRLEPKTRPGLRP